MRPCSGSPRGSDGFEGMDLDSTMDGVAASLEIPAQDSPFSEIRLLRWLAGVKSKWQSDLPTCDQTIFYTG